MNFRITSLSIFVSLFISIFAIVAQDDDKSADDAQALKIVPVVKVKPGETSKLLFSTQCTVGATRGGGFSLAEMREGKSVMGQGNGMEGASYSREGLSIRLPGWTAAEEFASTTEFAAARKRNLQVFEVTVSASEDASPGLYEMHLVDATCNGHCDTDFRVLIVPQ